MTRSERPPHRLRRRRALLLGIAVAAIGVGATSIPASSEDRDATPESTADAELPTVTAEVRTMAETEEVDGTVGYGDRRSLLARRQGTVTGLAAPGSVVGVGGVLFHVDNRPVVLLTGSTPSYRQLTLGVSDGPDVQQLEQSLVDLGYATPAQLTVDQRFTSSTAAAIRRWEKALGVAEDGVVEADDIVFSTGPLRIGEHRAASGSPVQPDTEVVLVTSPSQVVTVDLDTRLQHLAVLGSQVSIQLDSGTRTGTITAVAPTATIPEGDEAATVEVTITLDDPAAAGAVDQVPAEVTLTLDSRDVLAVPVNALLAVRSGGFAVEVRSEGDTRLVDVEVGLFALGYVEITGGDLAAGDEVVVPA